jgi:hypothetical protein
MSASLHHLRVVDRVQRAFLWLSEIATCFIMTMSRVLEQWVQTRIFVLGGLYFFKKRWSQVAA